jgi:hypothetical protein
MALKPENTRSTSALKHGSARSDWETVVFQFHQYFFPENPKILLDLQF